MLISVALNIFLIFLLPLMGVISDKIVGKQKLMFWTSFLSILIAYPVFLMLERGLSLSKIIFVQAVLGIITAGFGAPSMALLSTYFPVHERYSGIGFGYALGGALLGGTTPLILASLTHWLDSALVPAYYLMFSGLLGMTCVMWGKKTNYAISKKKPPLDELVPALSRA